MSLFCFSINTLFKIPYSNVLGLAVGSVVKNLPAVQETWVLPLGQEDPLEKEMATHFSILTWEIPGIEEPGGLQTMGLRKSQT